MMVLIILNEQERKVEKLRNTKVEVMQPKIKNKSVYYLENMGGRGGKGLRLKRRGLITFFYPEDSEKGGKGGLLVGGGGVLKDDFRVIPESDIPYLFYEDWRLVTVL